GNWTNDGTYSGSTGKVVLSGSAKAISGTGTIGFNNLDISGSGVTASASSSISLSGNLTTLGAGTFTQSAGGTVTLSGTGKYVTGSSITFANLSVTGAVTDSMSIGISGNLA